MDDGLWCRMVSLRLHARALGAWRPPTGPLLLVASVLDGALWSAGFFRVDPSIRHCLVAVTPMLTGIAAPSRLDGSACRLWDDAQSAGFRGGITILLRLPGSALGGFSLVTGMVGQEFLAWHKSHGRWATLAAHAIDQRYLTLVEPPSRRPQLSPREREPGLARRRHAPRSYCRKAWDQPPDR